MTAEAAGGKLAIDGGPEAVTRTLPGWPAFDDAAIRAVEDVLRSGKVNSRAFGSKPSAPARYSSETDDSSLWRRPQCSANAGFLA